MSTRKHGINVQYLYDKWAHLCRFLESLATFAHDTGANKTVVAVVACIVVVVVVVDVVVVTFIQESGDMYI